MIGVIGLGFVGLTTALGFAEKGFKVIGVEIDPIKINEYRNNQVSFYEPALANALERHQGVNFFITSDIALALKDCRIVLLCVGTPNKGDGAVDLGPIMSVLDEIAGVAGDGSYRTLVIKSTVPPGSRAELKQYLETKAGHDSVHFGLAINPEFLREGCAWDDFMAPDRIVIGCDNERDETALRGIYQDFGCPVHNVTPATAEFSKYLSNSFLATAISFSNEMSMLAYSLGDIDIRGAFEIFHQDKRWRGAPANMASYVFPGCGYGGYCLPKDTLALVEKAVSSGYEPSLLRSVASVNIKIRKFVAGHVAQRVDKGAAIGVLGLAFKPNSDDVRDSPAGHVINELLALGFTNILAYDPQANERFAALWGLDVSYRSSMKALCEETEGIIILTAWDEFIAGAGLLKDKQVFDFRYCID